MSTTSSSKPFQKNRMRRNQDDCLGLSRLSLGSKRKKKQINKLTSDRMSFLMYELAESRGVHKALENTVHEAGVACHVRRRILVLWKKR